MNGQWPIIFGAVDLKPITYNLYHDKTLFQDRIQEPGKTKSFVRHQYAGVVDWYRLFQFVFTVCSK